MSTSKKPDLNGTQGGKDHFHSFSIYRTGAFESEGPDLKAEMIELYYTIESLLSENEKKIILFVGSHENEGTTSIALEFARIAAENFGKAVLMLDANGHESSKEVLLTGHAENLLSHIQDEIPAERAMVESQKDSLSICSATNLGGLLRSPYCSRFMNNLRNHFDLVVIDAPPVNASAEALAIADRVDGVILVVEAEKTRWPVVNNVKDRLIKAGGNILGVILNKQRYYIPSWIYNRL